LINSNLIIEAKLILQDHYLFLFFFYCFVLKFSNNWMVFDVNLLTRQRPFVLQKKTKEYGWSRLSAGCVYSNDRSHAEHVWSNSCQLLFKVPLRNRNSIFICWPSLMAHNDIWVVTDIRYRFPLNNSPIRFYFFSFLFFG
jgi:hypothetical protein